MTIIEKIAYLKGLMEGMSFEAVTPEQKIISSVVDILDDMAKSLSDAEDEIEYLDSYVEEVDENLAYVEEAVYGDYDDEDEDFDEDEDDDEDDEEGEIYEFECPECGEKIYLSEELVNNEEIICPSCLKKLKYEEEE